MLTLPAYGFYWFAAGARGGAAGAGTHPPPEPLPEFVTLTAHGGTLDSALDGRERPQLERDVLPEFLARQRWFGGKDSAIARGRARRRSARFDERALRARDSSTSATRRRPAALLPAARRALGRGATCAPARRSFPTRSPRCAGDRGSARSSTPRTTSAFAASLVAAMRRRGRPARRRAALRRRPTRSARSTEPGRPMRPRRRRAEQRLAHRRRRGHAQALPAAASRACSRKSRSAASSPRWRGSPNTPAFLGSRRVRAGGAASRSRSPPPSPSCATRATPGASSSDALERDLEERALPPRRRARRAGSAVPLSLSARPRRRRSAGARPSCTRRFATPTDDPAFAAEPVDGRRHPAAGSARPAPRPRRLSHALRARAGLPEEAASRDRAAARRARRRSSAGFDALRGLAAAGLKTRIHGDYHLGQVLVAQDDVLIIDFEGEPQRALAERREKTSPLRDVAGMLRSFDYAAWSPRSTALRAAPRPGARHARTSRLGGWRDERDAPNSFLDAYRAPARAGILPDDTDAPPQLLDLFLLQKAFYEIGYEAAHRPAWLSDPGARRARHPDAGESAIDGARAKRLAGRAWRPDDGRDRRDRRGAARRSLRRSRPACRRGRRPLSMRVFWPGAPRARRLIDAATGEARRRARATAPRRAFSPASCRAGRAVPLPAALHAPASATWEAEDPYRFPPLLGELDVYLMAEGSAPRASTRSSARIRATLEGVDGTAFAVWAPNARRVSVVGDFNGWDGRRHPHAQAPRGRRLGDLPPRRRARRALQVRAPRRRTAQLLPLKADPVGFEQEHPPATASRVHGLPDHRWSDGDWMARRRGRAGACRADLDLRGASRLVAARRTTTASSSYDELGRRADPLRQATWASPMSSACRSPSIRSPAPGATSRSASSRRPAASARRRASPASSTAATRPASASSSTGCRRISRPTRTGSPASTAPRSTSTRIRASASTATGTR